MKKQIALTFDDGPAVTTEKIVTALAKHQAVATFFVNGSNLRRYSQYTERAIALGCEIGNHTEYHLDLTKLSLTEIIEEIETTNTWLARLNVQPRIMRPPFGYYNDLVKEAAKECGLALVNWSIDPSDWDSDDAETTRSRILAELDDGAIILCHDRMKSTAELMVYFIEELISADYQLLTISQLFAAKGQQLLPGYLYLSPKIKAEK